MQIFMTKSDINCDYSNTIYYFVNEYGYLEFYQLGSFDLALTVHKFDVVQDAISFTISMDKYPKVFELIKLMLDDIEKLKYLRETNIITSEYEMLYDKGYFSWKSDAPINECCQYKEEFVYSFFNIHKGNGSYILEFICNIDAPFFSVEVNTDRSRYEKLRFPVCDFYNKLEDACEKVDSNAETRKIIKYYHDQGVIKKTR